MPTATKPYTVSQPDHQNPPLLKSPTASASPAVTNPYAKKPASDPRVSFPLNLKSAPKAAPTPVLKASKYSPSPSPSAPVLKTPAVFRDITQPQLYRINLSAPTTALGGSLRVLEGFGYKSSLMNWEPEILKMELQDKEQV